MNIILKKGKIFNFYKNTYIFKVAEFNKKRLIPRKNVFNHYYFLNRLCLFRTKVRALKLRMLFRRSININIFLKTKFIWDFLCMKLVITTKPIIFMFKLAKFALTLYILFKIYQKIITVSNITKLIKTSLIKLCESTEIHEQISKLLLKEFVRSKSNQKRMTPIFCKLLHIKELNKRLDDLVKKIIIDYVRSKDCLEDLKKIVINEVLRNPEIKKELYRQLELLVQVREYRQFEDKITELMLIVLQIEAIQTHFFKRVIEEAHKNLADDYMVEVVTKKLFNTGKNN